MKSSKNYISKEAAIENLKRMFSLTPKADYLSTYEIFTAVGRQDQAEQTKRNWLANKMTQMKYHDLIQPMYRFGRRKELAGLKLTIAGKQGLGRISQANVQHRAFGNRNTPTTLDVAESIRLFKENYPEFDVVFEVRLKKDL